MAFAKAAQRAEMPEFIEYVQARLALSKAASLYSRFRMNCAFYEHSRNPLERLRFFEEKKAHSDAHKRLRSAQQAYMQALAIAECASKGVDLSKLNLAQLMEMSSLSTERLMQQESSEATKTEERTLSMDSPATRRLGREICEAQGIPVPAQFLEPEDLSAASAQGAQDTLTSTTSSTSIEFDEEFDKI